ncbi:hypothetical protein A6A06_14435 [Streptomyces sp. CB02923]|uniref:hypothetical protein n=1 Tax=Streptomyces sp. CB02923 TaxID=1718985 RepID=UPI00093B585E|nr:hypothetical protein [Streptomyces sp. CB02923]OKI02252.1 hypothetical protein A6A06_14435 [Streptomyces sp. CB02923]
MMPGDRMPGGRTSGSRKPGDEAVGDRKPVGVPPGAGRPQPSRPSVQPYSGALSGRFARWAVALSPRRKWALFGCWFTLDAVLALAPPVYWAAGDPRFQGGIPLSFCYFLALGAHISAGVIALYGVEAARGEID